MTANEGRKFDRSDEVLPAMYEHCVRTYKEMLSEAKAVTGTNGSIIVYEGFLTTLITQKVRLSVPYYGKIRTLLLEMGCVRQLKRGGGTSPSQFELITEPTEDAFKVAYANIDRPKGDTKIGKVSQRVLNLEQEVSRLKTQINDINQFLADQFGTEEV